MPAYADARYKAGDFPVAEECARTVLSLPLYPQMTTSHVEQVASSVRKLTPRVLTYSNR
jgi:dTDP-4-amino-4,6-dideoxygalactose transaminase